MPEPLTFDISLPGAEWISMEVSPAAAVRFSRDGGYGIQPSRPIVPEDFCDFGQRCDLSVLGYSSRDFRPEPVFHKGAQGIDDAYASIGLERDVELGHILDWCKGINGLCIEKFTERVNALDEAVLEVYHRRAVV